VNARVQVSSIYSNVNNRKAQISILYPFMPPRLIVQIACCDEGCLSQRRTDSFGSTVFPVRISTHQKHDGSKDSVDCRRRSSDAADGLSALDNEIGERLTQGGQIERQTVGEGQTVDGRAARVDLLAIARKSEIHVTLLLVRAIDRPSSYRRRVTLSCLLLQ
jgi:hypothetical protein